MGQDIDDATAARPRTDPTPSGGRGGGPTRCLAARARRRIGLSLRVPFAGLLAQPIPERFAALIADFAARSGQESSR